MLNNTQTYSDMWQNCLDRIKAQTSEEEFVKWFQPIVPLEFDGTNLRLRVPNESYVHQIEKNYIPFLRPIISQLYGQQTRLHYAVPRSTPPAVPVTADADTTAISRFNTQTNTANIKNPFVIPGLKKIIIDPQLNPGLTFATFIEGECNRLARSAGMSVAVNPGNNPFNPLYIYGDSGLGKTHIVQAIGHEVRQRHPELQVLYVSMNKFQAQFQTAYKNGEIPDFIHFYQMIDVLIIDDIQELTGKTGTQNAFFNIFNHLQLAGKQLILTSDKPPVELKDIEQRLLTRFKWGLSAQLNTPDYDTKLKIIRVKAQKFGAQISDDVVAYLADNISANVREIEGALSSLVANASFLGRKITTLREAHHLTCQDLADRCGCDVTVIEKLEAGEVPPSLAPLIKLTRALGVRLGSLHQHRSDGGSGAREIAPDRQGRRRPVLLQPGGGPSLPSYGPVHHHREPHRRGNAQAGFP